MPIVRRNEFDALVSSFSATGVYACDTETTGLRAYQGDRLFSVILANAENSYYLNFLAYAGLPEDWFLPREWLQKLADKSDWVQDQRFSENKD